MQYPFAKLCAGPLLQWVRTPVCQVADLKWTVEGILGYNLGPRRFLWLLLRVKNHSLQNQALVCPHPTPNALPPLAQTSAQHQSLQRSVPSHLRVTKCAKDFLALVTKSDRCLKVPN